MRLVEFVFRENRFYVLANDVFDKRVVVWPASRGEREAFIFSARLTHRRLIRAEMNQFFSSQIFL